MLNNGQIWEERIAECENSGMSRHEWCRKNGVLPQSYYYYLKRCSSRPFYSVIDDEDKLEYICQYLVSCETMKCWCGVNGISVRAMRYWITRLEKIEKYNTVMQEYKERRRLLKTIKLCDTIWSLHEYDGTIREWCKENNKSERAVYIAKRVYKILTTPCTELSESMQKWLKVVNECVESGEKPEVWCKEKRCILSVV